MSVSTEEVKTEAIQRMEDLHIFPETIRQFKNGKKVSISEPPFGAFYWAEGEDLQRIQTFEKKHNVLVYLVVRSYGEIGKIDSYLFVSSCPEEWPADREDIKSGQVYCYGYNHTMPLYSEFGMIGIQQTPAAGLIRTW